MAVLKEATIARWIGLSTDTKPTGVPVGATFYEYDTKLWYKTYDGTNWAVLALDYGLVFHGTCNSGMTASKVTVACADLAGYGNDLYNTQYSMQVIKNANSIGAAPDGEVRKITDYASTSGTFTVDAFSANVEESDEILVMHKSIMFIFAEADTGVTHDVTVANGTAEIQMFEIAKTTRYAASAYIDLNALVAAGEGGIVTIRFYNKIDEVTYRIVAQILFTVGTSVIHPSVEIQRINHNCKATIQCGTAVTVTRTINYRYITQDLE